MDEYEAIGRINLIAENNNCQLYMIDFQAKIIKIDGPKDKQVECAIAIDEFIDSCGEIIKVADDDINQLTDDIGWKI